MDAAKMAMDAEVAICKLRTEKQESVTKIAELDRQIEAWEGILAGLRFLGNPEAEMPLPRRVNLEGLGLRDAVVKILERSPLPLTPVEIREIMMLSGVTAHAPKNLLISIHTTLGRLGDVIEEVSGPDGKPAYRMRHKTAGQQLADLKMLQKRGPNVRTPLETAMQLYATPTGKKK
jgi:hypothetical protein